MSEDDKPDLCGLIEGDIRDPASIVVCHLPPGHDGPHEPAIDWRARALAAEDAERVATTAMYTAAAKLFKEMERSSEMHRRAQSAESALAKAEGTMEAMNATFRAALDEANKRIRAAAFEDAAQECVNMAIWTEWLAIAVKIAEHLRSLATKART